MTDLVKIVDQLSSLTVMQAAELVKTLEEKWGVSAAAPVAVAAAAAPVASDAAAEKTDFEVILASAGDKKINVIKAVRELNPALQLAEAKALVDAAPKSLKQNVTKEEAEKMKATLEAAGAKVELK